MTEVFEDDPVIDLESGYGGIVRATGPEAALVDFGPLLGAAWVPLGDLVPADGNLTRGAA